jgi:predicted RNase H-like nuclease (RuvC/YqgF family)
MKDEEPMTHKQLADMQMIIDGFLDHTIEKTTAIGADSVQINKLKKEITKLKKDVKKSKSHHAKLVAENRKLKEKLKEYEEYYDRFDIMDLGD